MSVEAIIPVRSRPALRLSPIAIFALTIMAVTLVIAVIGPWLAPYDPNSFTGDLNAAPSPDHWLGTDDLGQDVYSRLLIGTRLSLLYGASAALVALIAGGGVALLAMALGPVAEAVVFAIVDLIRALPGILFALACIVALEPGVDAVIIALGASFAPYFALMTRASYRQQMARPYTAAAKVLGAPPLRVAAVHVLPNIGGALVTQFAMVLPRCIVSESVLSFLGLGVAPETPTWGRMIASATPYIEQAPLAALIPIITLSVVTFTLAILGNMVRERLDPTRRSIEL